MQRHILQSQRNKFQTCRTHIPSASLRQSVNVAVLMCKSKRAARALRLFLLHGSLLSSLLVQWNEKATARLLSSAQPSLCRHLGTRKRNRGKDVGRRCSWTRREKEAIHPGTLGKALAQKSDTAAAWPLTGQTQAPKSLPFSTFLSFSSSLMVCPPQLNASEFFLFQKHHDSCQIPV